MKSAGYGTFKQKICVEIEAEDFKTISLCLGVDPTEIIEAENKAIYFVEREAKKYGKDEDIVYWLLFLLPENTKWKIDWERSEY